MSIEFLKNTKGQKLMVQMKNGNYLNGVLENIDMFMNIKMKEITYTSKDGNSFYNASIAFIRGSQVASINFEEDLLDNLNKMKANKTDSIINIIPNSKQKQTNQFLNRKRNNDNDTIKNRERGNDKGGYRGRRNDRGRGNDRGKYNRGKGIRGRGEGYNTFEA